MVGHIVRAVSIWNLRVTLHGLLLQINFLFGSDFNGYDFDLPIDALFFRVRASHSDLLPLWSGRAVLSALQPLIFQIPLLFLLFLIILFLFLLQAFEPLQRSIDQQPLLQDMNCILKPESYGHNYFLALALPGYRLVCKALPQFILDRVYAHVLRDDHLRLVGGFDLRHLVPDLLLHFLDVLRLCADQTEVLQLFEGLTHPLATAVLVVLALDSQADVLQVVLGEHEGPELAVFESFHLLPPAAAQLFVVATGAVEFEDLEFNSAHHFLHLSLAAIHLFVVAALRGE